MWSIPVNPRDKTYAVEFNDYIVAIEAPQTEQQSIVGIYHYAGNMHSPGMLMVYFPKTRMLVEADSYNPPGNPNNPPTAIPNLVHWMNVVRELGIEVDTLLPIHDRISLRGRAQGTGGVRPSVAVALSGRSVPRESRRDQ